MDKPRELFKEIQLAATDLTNADLDGCNPLIEATSPWGMSIRCGHFDTL